MRSALRLSLRCLLASLLAAAVQTGGVLAEDLELATAAYPISLAPLPTVAAFPPSLYSPDLRGDPRISRLWAETVEAERIRDVGHAAELKRRVLELLPGDVHTRWRLARDLLNLGEAMPADQKRERLRIYREARALASSAAGADPDCVECCFYDFAATSRIATIKGALRSISLIKASGHVLERCLAMEPSVWSDTDWNHERGNLYYGAAVYYRMVPDTWWMERLLGFRGDKRAAVQLARQAYEVTPSRIDYRVELGVALICLGNATDEDAARAEGMALLGDLDELSMRLATDPLDILRAAEVRAEPDGACGNARSFEIE
ncbi:MAG: hypothetical protein JRH01_03555 [Deltaproteobacteria bacterium]|nr:hypothetical protein [Deltaproteobacteria bacterium]MBW2396680.1 hypothetical protein [Deltaproteobacteria bacterium]